MPTEKPADVGMARGQTARSAGQLVSGLCLGATVGTLVGLAHAAFSVSSVGLLGKGLIRLALEEAMAPLRLWLLGGALVGCIFAGVVRLAPPLAGIGGRRRVSAWVLLGALVVAGVRWLALPLLPAGAIPSVWADGVAFALAVAILVLLGGTARAVHRDPGSTRHLLPALVAVLLVGGLQLTQQWSEPDLSRRPNVLLVVVDCLRPDHLHALGYERETSPAMDRLISEGMRFTRAYSTASWTKPAITSMLTGLYPNVHGTVDAYERPSSQLALLGERLQDSGYATLFYNGGNAFISDRFGFDRGFDQYAFIHPHNAVELTSAFLSGLGQSEGERFFAYLHYMDVHLPYNRHTFNDRYASSLEGVPKSLQPGQIFVKPIREQTMRGELAGAEQRLLRDLYDGQINLVDSQISRVLATLEQMGRLSETVVILTADHGEEFWEHDNFEHGHTLYEEVTRIPLVVWGAGVPSRTVTTPVSLVDVAPTVLALADAGTGDSTPHGRDLLSLREARTGAIHEKIYLMGTLYGPERFGLVHGRHKAILNTDQNTGKWPLVGARATAPVELYDLQSDPMERRNLVHEQPGLAAELVEEIREFRAANGAFETAVREADAELREKLRSLGYVQ